MRLHVSVRLELNELDAPPEPGARVRIEVRDTSLADAAARTVSTTDTSSRAPDADGVVAQGIVDVPDDTAPGAQLSVYAQLARDGAQEEREASGSGKVPGDWVTTRSYPLEATAGDRDVEVSLRRI